MAPDNKNPKDFVISLDLTKKKVSELKYDQKDGKLRIYITPEKEDITLEDFEFSVSGAALKPPPARPALKLPDIGPLKYLKIIGLLLKRLTYNEAKKIYITYIKKEELGD